MGDWPPAVASEIMACNDRLIRNVLQGPERIAAPQSVANVLSLTKERIGLYCDASFAYTILPGTMSRRISRVAVAILAILVGLYPSAYFIVGERFGVLASKSAAILGSPWWKAAFYTHITCGGIGLLIGWIQFRQKFRDRYVIWHRRIGKVYVVCCLLSAAAAIYVAMFTAGGIAATLGFGCLAAVWFYTTFSAFIHIRQGNVTAHQKMMLYSYAACFAAVTLRVYLPLLTMLFHDFITAYRLVAWLCWVPNIFVAWYLAKTVPAETTTARNTLRRAAGTVGI